MKSELWVLKNSLIFSIVYYSYSIIHKKSPLNREFFIYDTPLNSGAYYFPEFPKYILMISKISLLAALSMPL